MGYDETRRHLDPVREFFEKTKVLKISTSYVSQRKGEPSAMINVDAEFIGAYLRDDKLVVMMKFDDKKVDPFHVDIAYDAIRKRTKQIILRNFTGLTENELAVHVIDSTGNLADLELV